MGRRAAPPARGARARGGRDRQQGERARDRVRLGARAVRQEDRHLPGDLAFARRRLRRGRALALARLLGGVGGRRGRRAGGPRGRGGEVAGDRGRGAGVREVDPGARRYRLHVGAPAAPLLQARALARGRARVRPRASRGDRRIALAERPRHRGVDRDRRGDGAQARRARLAGLRLGAQSGRGARGDDRARLRRHGRRGIARAAAGSSGSTRSSTTPASRSRRRSSSCRPRSSRASSTSTSSASSACCRRSCRRCASRVGASC